MPDTFSKDERRAIMKKVKSSHNQSTELTLIKIFKELDIKGWRRNYPVVGKPDFVFPLKKIAVFTDGCFWHGHNCRNITPKHNSDYWEKKRLRNIARDKKVNELFIQRGWTVLRFWECEIKKQTIDLVMLLK